MCHPGRGMLWGLVAGSIVFQLALNAQNVIEIDSIEALQLIGKQPAYPLDGDYVLTQDIDASATAHWNGGKGFEPIGSYDYWDPLLAFHGTFDGQGHAVRNLYINRPEASYVGLFSYIAAQAKISRFGVEGGKIVGATRTGGLTGALAESELSQCYATCSVTGSDVYAGGLIGRALSGTTLSQCYGGGEVHGMDYVGGLAGEFSGTAANCFAVGPVTGRYDVGGLVGYLFGQVSECYSAGMVQGKSHCGGLIGAHPTYINPILASFWDGEFSKQQSSSGGEMLDTPAMLHSTPFIEAGWDFSDTDGSPAIWSQTEHETYPHFPWAAAPGETVAMKLTASRGGMVLCGPAMHGYPKFSPVVLTPRPRDWYWFAGWSGDVNWKLPPPFEIVPLNYVLCRDTSLHARFRRIIPVSSSAGLRVIGKQAAYPLDGYYRQTKDIDASSSAQWNGGMGHDPIGDNPTRPFSGVYDGQGYLIRNLSIHRPGEYHVGLFGFCTGILRNIGVEHAAITGQYNTGGVAGYVRNGIVERCHTEGAISGDTYTGGLIGYLDNAVVTDSYSLADVSSSGPETGGLIGDTYYASISRSFASGTVISYGRNTGGLVGGLWNHTTLSNCYSLCAVFPKDYCDTAGGLAGAGSHVIVDRCYAAGYVDSCNDYGGLFSNVWDSSKISYSLWDNITTGKPYSAGGGSGVDATTLTSLSILSGQYQWDFTDTDGTPPVWEMDDGVSYPRLAGLLPEDAAYTLTVTASGNGSVLVEPLQDSYAPNTLVYLTPQAAEGFYFTGWTGADTQDTTIFPKAAPFPVFMHKDIAITASFMPKIAINSVETLQKIGNDPAYPLTGSYYLTQDIDASATASWNGGKGFAPLGVYSENSPLFSFSGVFDGQGHVLRNLTINRPNESFVGLFSALQQTEAILHLGLENASITGYYYVGALAGSISKSSALSDCYTTGAVSGYYTTGGFAGEMLKSDVSSCFSASQVTGREKTGGFAGYMESSTATHCHADGMVQGNFQAGGFAGRLWESTTTACYALGDVSRISPGNAEMTGGFAGYALDSTFLRCHAEGNCTGKTYVGGLIAFGNKIDVSQCYAMGECGGYYYVGGLIAWIGGNIAEKGVRNCFAHGAVTGTTYCGGLIGLLKDCVLVTKSYATGEVTILNTDYLYESGGLVGGLVIEIPECTLIENSFWDIQTTGQADSAGGTGIPTAEMMHKATFTNEGWDFDAVWGIDAEESYPYLLWMLEDLGDE